VKKIIRAGLVAAVALAALSMSALPAVAASTGANLTSPSQMIRLNEDLTVFGIDLTSSTLVTKLNAVSVDFAQVGDSDFSFDDLQGSPDGVTLWRDSSNATPATQDILDGADSKVSTSFTTSGLRATLNIAPPDTLPDSEEGSYTYFMTVHLADGVSDGDDFTMTLPSDAFQTGTLSTSITPVTSNTITADPDAPTVKIFSPPAAQTDNVSWQLSEAVSGVSPSTVALRIHGTSTNVPATVSWNSATNTVAVDPSSPLMAGESYDALLLPDGAGGIVDKAGNALASDSRTFRAATDVSESAGGTAYSWRSVTNSSTYGGSYTVDNSAGAAATWTFTGTSVTWYTITDPYQGTASVYIDGRTKPSANNYSSTTKYKVARTYSGLSSAKHSITIRVSGVKGSSAGKDTRVAIDAFRVGGLYGTPSVSYRWATVASSGAAGGSYLSAKFPWTQMTFTFRGRSVDWRTILGPSMGKAAVYIDNVSKGTIDNYSGVTIAKFYRSFAGLSDGVHTIRIMVASTKNALAKDFNVAVDGFVVG
jgi:hypothetical protein